MLAFPEIDLLELPRAQEQRFPNRSISLEVPRTAHLGSVLSRIFGCNRDHPMTRRLFLRRLLGARPASHYILARSYRVARVTRRDSRSWFIFDLDQEINPSCFALSCFSVYSLYTASASCFIFS